MSNTHKLLELMRRQQRILFSPEIQFFFEQEKDKSKRSAFVEQRQKYVNDLQNLEKQNLERIATKMKSLDAELENAIYELDRELQNIDSTVRILNNINNVCRVLSQIFMKF